MWRRRTRTAAGAPGTPWTTKGPLPPQREGPFVEVWSRSAVRVLTHVVLEQQPAHGEEDRHRAGDDQPRVEEGQPERGQPHRDRDGDGPVAGGAEEAQLPGAVRHVGVLAVLGAGIDATGDEPEEPADEDRQA